MYVSLCVVGMTVCFYSIVNLYVYFETLIIFTLWLSIARKAALNEKWVKSPTSAAGDTNAISRSLSGDVVRKG